MKDDRRRKIATQLSICVGMVQCYLPTQIILNKKLEELLVTYLNEVSEKKRNKIIDESCAYIKKSEAFGKSANFKQNDYRILFYILCFCEDVEPTTKFIKKLNLISDIHKTVLNLLIKKKRFTDIFMLKADDFYQKFNKILEISY
jgi:hypothetical protein